MSVIETAFILILVIGLTNALFLGLMISVRYTLGNRSEYELAIAAGVFLFQTLFCMLYVACLMVAVCKALSTV